MSADRQGGTPHSDVCTKGNLEPVDQLKNWHNPLFRFMLNLGYKTLLWIRWISQIEAGRCSISPFWAQFLALHVIAGQSVE